MHKPTHAFRSVPEARLCRAAVEGSDEVLFSAVMLALAARSIRRPAASIRDGFECRVRLADGRLEETTLSYEEASEIADLGQAEPNREQLRPIAQALAGAGLRGKGTDATRTAVNHHGRQTIGPGQAHGQLANID